MGREGESIGVLQRSRDGWEGRERGMEVRILLSDRNMTGGYSTL